MKAKKRQANQSGVFLNIVFVLNVAGEPTKRSYPLSLYARGNRKLYGHNLSMQEYKIRIFAQCGIRKPLSTRLPK
jgi:hypothetical protein